MCRHCGFNVRLSKTPLWCSGICYFRFGYGLFTLSQVKGSEYHSSSFVLLYKSFLCSATGWCDPIKINLENTMRLDETRVGRCARGGRKAITIRPSCLRRLRDVRKSLHKSNSLGRGTRALWLVCQVGLGV